MGKPLFKASNGDWFDMLEESADFTQGELQQGLEMYVLIALKVGPEAFTTGSPMSVWLNLLQR